MKPILFFKILMMVFALVAVFAAIRGMSGQGVQKAFEAIGIEPGPSGSLQPGGSKLAPGEERFSICPTRIIGIEWVNGRKIEEAASGFVLKWLAFDPTSRPEPYEIGTIEVEKWLSNHCQIKVREVKPEAVAAISARATLTIRYVGDRQSEVIRMGGRFFQIEGKYYESEDFASALRELQEIAQFNPASGL